MRRLRAREEADPAVEVALDDELRAVLLREARHVDRERGAVLLAGVLRRATVFGPGAVRGDGRRLDDAARGEGRGEVIEQEREAAIDDVGARGGAEPWRQRGVDRDPVQRAGEVHRRAHTGRVRRARERDAAPAERVFAGVAVERGIGAAGGGGVLGRRSPRACSGQRDQQGEDACTSPPAHRGMLAVGSQEAMAQARHGAGRAWRRTVRMRLRSRRSIGRDHAASVIARPLCFSRYRSTRISATRSARTRNPVAASFRVRRPRRHAAAVGFGSAGD